MSATLIFVSRRAQRVVFALLTITLANILVAQCTPEPVQPLAAVRIFVSR